jgi:hypothetical protein
MPNSKNHFFRSLVLFYWFLYLFTFGDEMPAPASIEFATNAISNVKSAGLLMNSLQDQHPTDLAWNQIRVRDASA